ncbi:hypothetical protein [Roseateles puraquae]|uniref:Uncharacterized protein n=1 Tax=Roseateles puraquae TaxID=431059 RepID=A0A254NAW7_9BURK|nr:hypothetical protein [Roseateles puraquae]MDG0853922.1 hypothetical protein [Roseateles puraquae]OWR04754.1 hypothetical protein CDO81_09260 [Roseateles puraquae]
MNRIAVQITAFVDEHQPGFVECALIDADGRLHKFIEKASVVSDENLRQDSIYPRPGSMACELQAEWTDDAGRTRVKVNTERAWGIESLEGLQDFVLFKSQLL